ncbi:MAG: HupE/UreJ family protein [Burkholderiaceae bacterium]
MSLTRAIVRIVMALVLAGCAGAAFAHKPSDAYLFVTVHEAAVGIRWDIALRDLDAAFDLDANGDRSLTWGEAKTHFDEIDRYALSHLKLEDGRCVPVVRGHAIDHHSDGAYLVVTLEAPCHVVDRLKIDYQLFTEIDPTHRGIVRIAFGSSPPALVVLDPAGGAKVIDRSGQTASGSGSGNDPFAGGFFPAGVHHILIGYDHVLFLICLLLPAVLVRIKGGWRPVAKWTEAAKPILITVTAFTIAHTITLALAGLRIVELSPRVIEPAIAATIILTAIGNIWPSRFRETAAMPFAFGLVHGFGFADVLRELDLPLGQFVWALLRFNLGVEAGQLIIVVFALTPLYLLRRWRFYRRGILMPISIAATVVAAIWFAERVFDFKILPL